MAGFVAALKLWHRDHRDQRVQSRACLRARPFTVDRGRIDGPIFFHKFENKTSKNMWGVMSLFKTSRDFNFLNSSVRQINTEHSDLGSVFSLMSCSFSHFSSPKWLQRDSFLMQLQCKWWRENSQSSFCAKVKLWVSSKYVFFFQYIVSALTSQCAHVQ